MVLIPEKAVIVERRTKPNVSDEYESPKSPSAAKGFSMNGSKTMSITEINILCPLGDFLRDEK